MRVCSRVRQYFEVGRGRHHAPFGRRLSLSGQVPHTSGYVPNFDSFRGPVELNA